MNAAMTEWSGRANQSRLSRNNWIAVFALAILGLFSLPVFAAGQFDHDNTRFPLDVNHQTAKCDECHIQGIFKGTPTQCHSCHSAGSQISASAPSPTHIRTTQDCEFCHLSGGWNNVIKVDHFAVIGSCQSCHNGRQSRGKGPSHIQSSNNCDDCHRTISWDNAVFDHTGVTANCNSCHNGVTASGKNASHILSNNTCDDCHRTIAWSPVVKVDHDAVIGSCASCHNGVIARGKHPEHLATTAQCDECHTVQSWTTGVFNHAGITAACSSCHNGTNARGKDPQHIASTNSCELCHNTNSFKPVVRVDHDAVNGSCSSCHNGTVATGKPSGHFITSSQCNECHSTVNWSTVRFTHQSMNYPGDHSGNLACIDCHQANQATISWPFPAYVADCAACHADDYVPDKHENASVSALRDCSGACHEPAGRHRVTDSGWN